MTETLKVLFLSPEVVPFAKTGGLADVAGSLPGALKKLDVDVRVGLPYYRAVKEGRYTTKILMRGLKVPLGEQKLPSNVLETQTEDRIPVYFFEREDLFDRPNLYGTPEGDYYDNLERFAFFSQAALLLAKEIDFDFEVVHCHDWQTGLVPIYLKTLFRKILSSRVLHPFLQSTISATRVFFQKKSWPHAVFLLRNSNLRVSNIGKR